jgi:hypothetical protein
MTPTRIYRMPLLLAAGSILGLLAALLGDGMLDILSWLALGAIVLLICRILGGRSNSGG